METLAAAKPVTAVTTLSLHKQPPLAAPPSNSRLRPKQSVFQPAPLQPPLFTDRKTDPRRRSLPSEPLIGPASPPFASRRRAAAFRPRRRPSQRRDLRASLRQSNSTRISVSATRAAPALVRVVAESRPHLSAP